MNNKKSEALEAEIIDSEELIDIKIKKSKKEEKEENIATDDFDIISDINFLNTLDNVEYSTADIPVIETQEINIKQTGNYIKSVEKIINFPLEMIVFPFFTTQKQNKQVNFKYKFHDLGVIMRSTLVMNDVNDKIYQPSIFEEKIFTYLISMYEEKQNDEKNKYIEFEISDFIVNFLGNKMNRVYYSKVEQALKNLKKTIYSFEVTNYTKLGKYQFDDEDFSLINYQKLKIGKKIFYRVKINDNILNKLQKKRYIKYKTKNFIEIMNKDPIAAKIYKYISQIRYDNHKGIVNIRVLASLIPLKMEQITERVNKNGKPHQYVLSRMKQVLGRILKAFENLKDLGYISEYYEEYVKDQEIYYINYVFNKKRDGDCHISEHVQKIEYAKIKQEENQQMLYSEYSDQVYYAIMQARKNKIVNKKWNKRVDTKIDKIINEDGEIIAIRLLNIIETIKTEIETTLVQYINGILKNIKTKKEDNKNMTLQYGVKGLINKNKIKKQRIKKSREQGTPIQINKKIENEEVIIKNIQAEELLKNFDEETRQKIENKAIELFKQINNLEDTSYIYELKKTSTDFYYKFLGNSILDVINNYYKK